MSNTKNNLNAFKAELGFGVRPNQFRVNIGINTFLVKAANLPGVTNGDVTVPVLGRTLKLPGDISFDSWSVTVVNNEAFNVRAYLEDWVNTLAEGTLIERDITVEQLDKRGAVLKRITLINAFPKNLSAMDVSYDSADSIQEFTCDFDYQYWE